MPVALRIYENMEENVSFYMNNYNIVNILSSFLVSYSL